MNITVIVCTYNRCQSLATALESIAASQMPSSAVWEVLVVDNNSRDQTPEIVQDFGRRFPDRFRYVFEARQGLSNARNAGIREARGDIIVFTDDDITVEPNWLQNLTASLHGGNWAGAGGRILPAQTFSPPPWLALDGPYGMGGVLYAHFDLGGQAGELDRAPHGANMAFQKYVFEKFGGFRTDLGRSSDSLLGNEDTEFGRRLMARGERLRYEPSAVVYHELLETRANKQYFLTWWFNYGRAQMRESGMRPGIAGIPRHYFSIPHVILRHLPTRILQWALALSPQSRFYRKCMVWVGVGWLVETYQLARHDKRQSEKCSV